MMDEAYLAAHPKDEKFIRRNLGRCTGLLHGHAKDCPGGRTSVTVGHSALGGLFFTIEVGGMAYTFREAFAQIDAYKALESARYRAAICKRRGHHRPDRICGRCLYSGPKRQEHQAIADPADLKRLIQRPPALGESPTDRAIHS